MKSVINIFCAALLTAASAQLKAQQTPAGPQSASILITGATAHLGNGQVIENSAVGFDKGIITFVGTASEAPSSSFSEVIDASGKHVYPGFIGVNTTLGLVEIDAVRATDDIEETGDLLPHIRSLIAYNAESLLVESMRPNGLLMAQITPRGSLISGSSSIVQLDAWNWEDAAVKTDDAIHVEWPNSFRRGRTWMGEEPGMKPNENYRKSVDQLRDFLLQAKAYTPDQGAKVNLPFAATKGIFDGSQRLFIHADGRKEIEDALHLSQSMGLENIVLVGGDEAHLLAETLAARKIPVVIRRPHRIPETEDSNVKHPFMLASLLMEKGILVGIDVEGQMERMNTRNLPFYAGTAAAYGIDREKAVQLITGNAAAILGIDDIAGTLETGKQATLFISEGDALDMRTNKVSRAFIQGRDISLDTRQKELWKRYADKFGQ